MIIPNTVNKNILLLFQPPEGTFISKRKTFAENFEQWDKKIPKRLRELCIEYTANNWSSVWYNTLISILKLRLVQPLFKEIPLLADRLLLLDVLATDLPLEITVPIIHEDVYWRRCYEERWPKQLPEHVASEVNFPICSSNTSSRTDNVIDDSRTSHTEDVSPIINDLSCGFETKTWKHYYLEMHVKDFLEKLRPEEYESEKVILYQLYFLCNIS